MKESVPGSIIVDADDHEKAARLVNQFIEETITAVKSVIVAHDDDFNIETGDESEIDGPKIHSTFLRYKGGVLAIIKEVRIGVGQVRYDFFRNLDELK